MADNYFEKLPTYHLISELSRPMDWTIYVGLGATLDRTGASWESLVLSLFARQKIPARDAGNWIKNLKLAGASTTVEGLYLADASGDLDKYSANLREDIRRELYGYREHLKGRLLEELAEFGFLNAEKGKNVVFVTPNYDTYLDQALISLEFPPAASGGPRGILQSSVSIEKDNESLPGGWDAAGTVTCVHVHGRVGPHNRDDLGLPDSGVPVLGELQYAESQSRTVDTLTRLFKDRNVLIVGSSLTDGPLVKALIDSKNNDAGRKRDRRKRYVIQPMQGSEWQVEPDQLNGLLQLNRVRLSALGLENTRPQYFSQSAQIISEITGAMEAGDGHRMTNESFEHRYDNRMKTWWREWSAACIHREDVQFMHHQWLRVAAEMTRDLLAAKPDEQIKVEVWARWDPMTAREIALWASSVGSLNSQGAMHIAKVETDSTYRSVSIFRFGSPQILHSRADRWKSYFGFPIWSDRPASAEDAPIARRGERRPLGVVTIASRWSGEAAEAGHAPGCVAESNLKRVALARDQLERFGNAILEGSRTSAGCLDWDRQFRGDSELSGYFENLPTLSFPRPAPKAEGA